MPLGFVGRMATRARSAAQQTSWRSGWPTRRKPRSTRPCACAPLPSRRVSRSSGCSIPILSSTSSSRISCAGGPSCPARSARHGGTGGVPGHRDGRRARLVARRRRRDALRRGRADRRALRRRRPLRREHAGAHRRRADRARARCGRRCPGGAARPRPARRGCPGEIPRETLGDLNRELGGRVVKRIARRRARVLLGRELPFGLGVALGGVANYRSMHHLGRTAIKYLQQT